MPDIFKAWRDVGLPEPIIEELFGAGHPDRTVITLPLKAQKDLGTSLGTAGAADDEKSKRLILLEFCREPRSKNEIQEYLGVASESYVRQALIYPLLESGDLLRTIPDKPKSPKQKYVTIT